MLRLATPNLRLSFSGRSSVHRHGDRRPRVCRHPEDHRPRSRRRPEDRRVRVRRHLEDSRPPVRRRPDGAQHALDAPPILLGL